MSESSVCLQDPTHLSLPPLDNTLGAWLMGTFFGILMQGMILHQTYRYFRLYPKDSLYLKVWVLIGRSLLDFFQRIMETLNTALTMHSSYAYLITSYFNPAVLLCPPIWSVKITVVNMDSTAFVWNADSVRHRCAVGRRYRIVVIAAMTCYIAFIGEHAIVRDPGSSFGVADLQEFYKYSWLASVGSILMMVGDVFLTAILIYVLRQSRTGGTRTDSLLDLLIIYAVSTGELQCANLPHSVLNELDIIRIPDLALALPNNLIYTAISIMLTKLYANTFLVALNTRQSLIDRGIIGANETAGPFSTTVMKGGRVPLTMPDRETTVKFACTGSSSETAAIELKMMANPSRDTDINVSERKSAAPVTSGDSVAVTF
ncbi:hypothetical protein BV20DRAFT_946484 [Pilatotrama ljubarskyi]|nr:hypothetical protein BV20DRAFT_946484 [Pilatotrama ljubarskyi]